MTRPAQSARGLAGPALVVGAGLGGLAAAIELAAAGYAVTVLEAADQPGGKAGTVVLPGDVTVDTGPSVLTMPEVLRPLLAHAGLQVGVDVHLRQPEPAFRYRFVDGVQLDLHHDPDQTALSIGAALGSRAEAEFRAFLAYSGRIWDAAAPRFVFGPAPSWRTVLSVGLPALLELPAIDPLRSMQRAIRRAVRSEHLRMILARYATYNGSDVRRAPATLNCIAHVELALGGYGIQGGIHALVAVLVQAAEQLGVRLVTGAPVAAVTLAPDGTVSGVSTHDGDVFEAPVVVCNADVGWLRGALPPGTRHGLKPAPEGSMSGWNAVVQARRQATRPAHEVLFCTDYDQEFADIFDRDRPPVEPTVYLCAQERAHGRTGWPAHEPVFLMVNTPPEPEPGRGPSDPAVWETVEATALGRLRGAGLLGPDDAVVWRRTPTDLARSFPGSRGSLYGAASNDPFAAFRRPSNRLGRVPGLYLATGSAHPGGGMPLALRSGTQAALAVAADRPAPLTLEAAP